MGSPPGWSTEWDDALQIARNTSHYVRTGLNSLEFAALAGVHCNTPGRYARRGIEVFKAKFGEGCSFELVNRPNSSQKQWRFTFSGPLREHPDEPPISGLIRGPEFCQICKVSDITLLWTFTCNGHAWFRQKFPGWDFLEVPQHGTKSTIRWYGRIEALGEQPEGPLPEDNLTAKQFGQLKGIWPHYVTKLCRNEGLDKFQLKFPGWSFREEAGSLVYFRIGPEVEVLKLAQFARRMGTTSNVVSKWVEKGVFAEKFPDWQVKILPVENSKWRSWFFSPKVPEEIESPSEMEPNENLQLEESPDSSDIGLLEASSCDRFEIDQGWTSEWQAALAGCKHAIPEFHSDLTTPEFSRLVGIRVYDVHEAAKKGLEHFKALFGQHSSFQYLPEVARWERWRFTFHGIVHPLAREGIGVSLMSVADFARYLKVPEDEVRDYSQRGHRAFRERFAGWEFLEYQVSEHFPLERWYGSVESLGEQPEAEVRR